MRLAQRHLRDDDRSLASLSSSLGYASESAFSSAFKRVTGIAPERVPPRRARGAGSTDVKRSHDGSSGFIARSAAAAAESAGSVLSAAATSVSTSVRHSFTPVARSSRKRSDPRHRPQHAGEDERRAGSDPRLRGGIHTMAERLEDREAGAHASRHGHRLGPGGAAPAPHAGDRDALERDAHRHVTAEPQRHVRLEGGRKPRLLEELRPALVPVQRLLARAQLGAQLSVAIHRGLHEGHAEAAALGAHGVAEPLRFEHVEHELHPPAPCCAPARGGLRPPGAPAPSRRRGRRRPARRARRPRVPRRAPPGRGRLPPSRWSCSRRGEPGRATTVTSWPARARWYAKVLPIPPIPTTAMERGAFTRKTGKPDQRGEECAVGPKACAIVPASGAAVTARRSRRRRCTRRRAAPGRRWRSCSSFLRRSRRLARRRPPRPRRVRRRRTTRPSPRRSRRHREHRRPWRSATPWHEPPSSSPASTSIGQLKIGQIHSEPEQVGKVPVPSQPMQSGAISGQAPPSLSPAGRSDRGAAPSGRAALLRHRLAVAGAAVERDGALADVDAAVGGAGEVRDGRTGPAVGARRSR